MLAFCAVLAILLLYFAHRYTAQRRYAHKLEFEVARRTDHIRKVEEELTRSKRLESMASFAGGVAHDFNNMLTGISGNVAFASLKLAEGEVDASVTIIGELLDFSRVIHLTPRQSSIVTSPIEDQ